MPKCKDFLNQYVEAGDYIVYPVKKLGSLEMKVGVVLLVEFVPDFLPGKCASTIKATGVQYLDYRVSNPLRMSTITRADRVVKVDRSSVPDVILKVLDNA